MKTKTSCGGMGSLKWKPIENWSTSVSTSQSELADIQQLKVNGLHQNHAYLNIKDQTHLLSLSFHIVTAFSYLGLCKNSTMASLSFIVGLLGASQKLLKTLFI